MQRLQRVAAHLVTQTSVAGEVPQGAVPEKQEIKRLDADHWRDADHCAARGTAFWTQHAGMEVLWVGGAAWDGELFVEGTQQAPCQATTKVADLQVVRVDTL